MQGRSYAVSRHPSGYYYVKKVTGARTMEKLLAENVKLQRQLKVTRQNNAILRKQKSDLTLANEEIKADYATGNTELIVMKKKFAELRRITLKYHLILQVLGTKKMN